MAKKPLLEDLTEEDIYDELKELGYEISDINQILKAKESGFDMYEYGMKLTTKDLREFRNYITENLDPVFNAKQLQALHVAFIKGIPIKDIADKTLTHKQMHVLIDAKDKNFDIDAILKHRKNDTTMKNAYQALCLGMNKEDLLKYEDNQIKCFVAQIKGKDSVNVIPYLEKNFTPTQILEIVKIKKTDNIDLSDYLTSEYNIRTFSGYAQIIKIVNKNTLKKSKNIFSPKYDEQSINYMANIIKTHNPYEKYVEFFNKNIIPEYSYIKILALTMAFKKNVQGKYIEHMKELEFKNDDGWLQIAHYIKENKDISKILDSNLPTSFIPLIGFSYNVDLLIDLYNKNFSYDAAKRLLIIDTGGFGNIVKYVNNETTLNEINEKHKMLSDIKFKKLQDYEEFIMKNIDSKEKLSIFKSCIGKYDINKINFKLSPVQLKCLIGKYPENLEISFKINKQYQKAQTEVILKALNKGYDPGILNEKNFPPYKCQALYKIIEFNETNTRQIDINNLADLECDPKEFGEIVKFLTSNNLDDNIKGYDMIKRLTKEKEIEKNIEITK